MFANFDYNQDGMLSDAEFKAAWDFANTFVPDDDDDEPNPPNPDEDDEEEHENDCEAGDFQCNFDWWVDEQKIPETPYYCYLDISTSWVNGYYFFAGHDCDIYDLTLTVMAKKTDWDERMTTMNTDANMLDCEDIGNFDRACYFTLSHKYPKLGIAFDSDAEVDLYYETAWESVITTEAV